VIAGRAPVRRPLHPLVEDDHRHQRVARGYLLLESGDPFGDARVTQEHGQPEGVDVIEDACPMLRRQPRTRGNAHVSPRPSRHREASRLELVEQVAADDSNVADHHRVNTSTSFSSAGMSTLMP
jgi:hypothetical protein